MTAQQLAVKLGRPVKWVYRNKKALAFLELARPVGFDRYSAVLVEQHINGERVTNFGRNRFKDRMAS